MTRSPIPSWTKVVISRYTGALEGPTFCVEPGMREAELLQVVTDAEQRSSYAGWNHYSFRLGDWTVLASFRSERLKNVSLAYVPPSEAEGARGGDWSVERKRERERQLTHDKFLRRWLGWSIWLGRRQFPWGRVESARDPMTGDASITVSYEP